MESIVIYTNNKEELNLLREIAEKMGFKSQIISDSDKEDLGLSKAIQENSDTEGLTFNEAIEYYKILDKAK